MIKHRSKLILFLSISCFIGLFKALHLERNTFILDIIAKNYFFDERYYLENYPAIKSQNISPFEHFSYYGWKEDKNPYSRFNTRFYKNFSMTRNKGKLNPLQHYISSKIMFKNLKTHPDQLFKVDSVLVNPRYYLALVAVFRDEARFLKEWIEFHKMLGVEHFYLYNHKSQDNFLEILDPYIKAGIVELENIDFEPTNLKSWHSLQTEIYSNLSKRIANEVEWLVVIDTDEFLFPVKNDDLPSLLKSYDSYASLSVNWKMFGSSNIRRVKDSELLIESLMFSADKEDIHVKSIVKPRYVVSYSNPHFPKLKDGYGQVTENFEYFYGPFAPKESRNLVRINHYWARDLDFFESVKLKRVHIINKKLGDEDKRAKIEALWEENKNISRKYDGSILRLVPRLQIYLQQSNKTKVSSTTD